MFRAFEVQLLGNFLDLQALSQEIWSIAQPQLHDPDMRSAPEFGLNVTPEVLFAHATLRSKH
jgi:hypothetical protein